MKNTKRLLAAILAMLMVLSLAACGKDGGNATTPAEDVAADSNVTEATAQTEPVKSDGYEKFSQLKIGMTESEVNAILGEPVSVDKAYYYYNIVVNGQDMELEVWINTGSGLVTYISGDFSANEYRAEFMDSNTDLSAVGDLESGALATYDDCAKAFKTPGYLMSIDEDGETVYLWVDANDGYLRVTFNADGTVRKYAGFC